MKSNQTTDAFDASKDLHYRQPFMDRSNGDVFILHPATSYCSAVEVDVTRSQLSDEGVIRAYAIDESRVGEGVQYFIKWERLYSLLL